MLVPVEATHTGDLIGEAFANERTGTCRAAIGDSLRAIVVDGGAITRTDGLDIGAFRELAATLRKLPPDAE